MAKYLGVFFLSTLGLVACGAAPATLTPPPAEPAASSHTGDRPDTAAAHDTGPGETGGTQQGHEPLTVSFAPDLARTDHNPLRGFFTAYAWGDPVTDHPASLEFAYVPLAVLMSGPESFAFETGLEPLLVAAEARGHQLVFRPYLDYPGLPSGLPDFLEGTVDLQPYADHGGGLSPDYGHPELQAALLDFIAALGARYDGDPRLAVVQLGLLGFWGEWHTWPHSDWFADPLFQQEVLQAYDDAFSTTLLQTRYPSEATADRQIGYHDDSFAHSTLGDIEWFFVSLLGAAEATDRWQRVPVGGELRPELQSEIFEPGYTTGTYRQDFAACVEATHASFLLNYTPFGRGFDSDAEEARTREAARLLGYALHLTEADLGPQTLTLTLENRGVAPFYHPVVVEVEDANGTATQTALPLLLPGSDPDEIALDVVNLAAPSPDAPWTVRLLSEHILPNQTLRLATAPGNGAIQVE